MHKQDPDRETPNKLSKNIFALVSGIFVCNPPNHRLDNSDKKMTVILLFILFGCLTTAFGWFEPKKLTAEQKIEALSLVLMPVQIKIVLLVDQVSLIPLNLFDYEVANKQ